jgi:PKD repeat protein
MLSTLEPNSSMKYLIFSLCLLLYGHIIAQKHDNIWHLNNHAILPDDPTPAPPTYAIDFQLDSFQTNIINTKLAFVRSAAFFSDSLGNLQLQTAGCFIANAQGDTIENGSEIGVGNLQYNISCSYGFYGVWQYGFFLQDPGNPNRVYFFNPFGNSFLQGFQYQHIEKTNGSYRIIAKNRPVLNDSIMLGGYIANKHANGRDWWLIFKKRTGNRLYKFLLDPTGISNQGFQDIGTPVERIRHNEMVFNHDGSLLAQANPAEDLRLWDFDRCSGELSNPRHYSHIDTADTGNSIVSGGMAISHDGRYLYRGNSLINYQYDLQATDIGGSLTVVAEYENSSPMYLGGEMELGSDGRIYIKPANGTAYRMHVITHPERPQAACGFERDYHYFPKGFAAMPMFPNYRLGPIDGSPCDTLGLNNYPLAGFRYDRLAGLLVDFTSVSWYEPETWSWNFGDPSTGLSNTSNEMHPNHVFSAPGYYNVCLTVSNQYGSDSICKRVYIDASVDAQEPQLTETEQGVLVYPNPANAWVEFLFPTQVSGTLSLYSVNGAEVFTQNVENSARTQAQVSALPAGVYAWVLREPSGKVWRGKVAVVR